MEEEYIFCGLIVAPFHQKQQVRYLYQVMNSDFCSIKTFSIAYKLVHC